MSFKDHFSMHPEHQSYPEGWEKVRQEADRQHRNFWASAQENHDRLEELSEQLKPLRAACEKAHRELKKAWEASPEYAAYRARGVWPKPHHMRAWTCAGRGERLAACHAASAAEFEVSNELRKLREKMESGE